MDEWDKRFKEDFKRKDWFAHQWLQSDDALDRLVGFIWGLSPHNLWKAKESIREYSAIETQAAITAVLEQVRREVIGENEISNEQYEEMRGAAIVPGQEAWRDGLREEQRKALTLLEEKLKEGKVKITFTPEAAKELGVEELVAPRNYELTVETVKKIEKKLDDLQPFKHGQDGTHYACPEMMEKLGGDVGCCGCNRHQCME